MGLGCCKGTLTLWGRVTFDKLLGNLWWVLNNIHCLDLIYNIIEGDPLEKEKLLGEAICHEPWVFHLEYYRWSEQRHPSLRPQTRNGITAINWTIFVTHVDAHSGGHCLMRPTGIKLLLMEPAPLRLPSLLPGSIIVLVVATTPTIVAWAQSETLSFWCRGYCCMPGCDSSEKSCLSSPEWGHHSTGDGRHPLLAVWLYQTFDILGGLSVVPHHCWHLFRLVLLFSSSVNSNHTILAFELICLMFFVTLTTCSLTVVQLLLQKLLNSGLIVKVFDGKHCSFHSQASVLLTVGTTY